MLLRLKVGTGCGGEVEGAVSREVCAKEVKAGRWENLASGEGVKE